MRLEPRRLIGKQRIRRCVAFIEAIARKLVDQVEQLVRLRRWNLVVFGATLYENCPLRIHFRFDFLTHRAAQLIRAAKRIACENLRGLHDLFLINENAISFGKDRLKQNMGIFD